ncbi:MAG: 1-deoxy-D-xylulose-5-phosphate reductoisomerase [Fimbriimonadaceae bacterium]|nr:1-deoxy-D-xylulose-5-phosphate reductoisomerase [Fimbriimonadaceae bacterium]QYK55486.1 MAG: 1-deoxy-D-xylulose-5-phosphate reductoisomerase [Fimbriimonadaceae bacterium]
MRSLVILGSTGSIGTQTLDVVRRHPNRLRVVGASAYRSAGELKAQADQFGIPKVALMDEALAAQHEVPGGMGAVVDLVTAPEVDLVVVAVAGVIGLVPTLAAIRAGKDIALASKEILVAAGEVVMPLVRTHGVRMTPIDSEHSAVYQCLQGYTPEQVSKIVLTASGGPFRGRTRHDLEQVTVQQALDHPTWKMGGKITVDSATLMNKALETIEARWLFDTPIDRVDAVVHPQSIVHSFVEFTDGSYLAQLGWPDMRLPIQYALLAPERPASDLRPWNPLESSPLTFEAVDHATFPALQIARKAVEKGGTTPSAFNAANEVAANAFLQGRCGFLQIADTVSQVTEEHRPSDVSFEAVQEADDWARGTTRQILRLE